MRQSTPDETFSKRECSEGARGIGEQPFRSLSDSAYLMTNLLNADCLMEFAMIGDLCFA